MRRSGWDKDMEYLVICILALLAGTVQSFTGFGAGAVIMSVLPYFYGITMSPGICQIICMALVIMMLIRRRQSIRLRQILLPAIIFTLSSVLAIHFVPSFDRRILTIAFGIFLIAMSLFSLLKFSDLRVTESVPKMVVASSVSGMLSGLFGVGGPLIATYLVSVTEEYEVYLANMQMIFFISNVFSISMRFIEGMVPKGVLPLCALGIVFIIAGYFCGEFLLNRVNEKYDDSKAVVKKTVYILVGVSGILTILSQLI